MTLLDKNQTLEPPEDYTFVAVEPQGAFLRAEYRQKVFKTDTLIVTRENVVTVYLNDMGREVARTMVTTLAPLPEESPAIAPVGRWYRFRNAFYMTLEGLQEMFRSIRGE